MERPVQLVFDLAHPPALGGADFLAAPCNAQAHALVLRWPDWPSAVVLLHGPEASGKTHLARILAERSGAVALAGPALRPEHDLPSLLGTAPACIVEDVDRGCCERSLFHLHNLVAERRGHLLLTARRPAGRWRPALADLDSRLRAAFPVAIQAPDDALLCAVLVKQFADRQLRVEPGVVGYLAKQMERSFEAVQRLVAALDAASLRTRRPVTLAVARAVLAQLDAATAQESHQDQT